MKQLTDHNREIDTLNESYGKPGIIFQAGRGNLTTVRLEWENNIAVAYLLGGQLTSWQQKDCGEQIFLSRDSYFQLGKAIRGGVPICYPQFGPQGPLTQHGFARNSLWLVKSTRSAPEGVSVVLELDDRTAQLWPGKPTVVELQILLSDSISMQLAVTNVGTEVIEITHAFHSYFRVSSIERAVIEGLNGTSYIDKVNGGEVSTETRDRIQIEAETDRIYLNAPDCIHLLDTERGLVLSVEKSRQQDAVIWNPWSEKAKALKDFGDDEYQRMICLETGNIGKPVCIGGGASLVVEQKMSVRRMVP